MKTWQNKRRAFTLVELLVVIAIIGILFVVLISKVDFATEKSKATGVQTDFRSYQVAIETVARENAGLSVLVDNDATGVEKYAELEKALNKNLDPKLRVEIDADGKISTEAKDPWKEQYLGAYLAPDADGTVKDRGAIVMYSKGSNLKLGTTAATENGIVNVTLESGKETEGADDYSISTIYTYINGYGEIQASTSGFSNNQGDVAANGNNGSNVTPSVPGGSDPSDPGQGGDGGNNQTPDPSDPDDGDDEPVGLAAGLYDANDNLVADWDELVNTYGMDVEKDYTSSTYKTDTASPYYVLTNTPALANGVKITISDTITKIGNYAFDNCKKLTTLDLGSSVTSIGDRAFSWCLKLTSVVIPDSVTWIGPYAFQDCDLTGTLIIPDNVTNIGEHAFEDCNGLTSLDLGSGVTSIGKNAFQGCSGLTGTLVIPDSVTSIGKSAFWSCSGLDSILVDDANTVYHDAGNCLIETASKTLILGCKNSIIPNDDRVTNIGESAFNDCIGLTGTLVIPDSIKSIEMYAFSWCGITELVISDSVTSIGHNAFGYCSNLTSIKIGRGLVSLGVGSFQYCESLASISVDDANTTYHDNGNCLIETATRILVQGCNNSIIPDDDSVISIADYAFAGCSGLTGTLVIPDSVTSIGECAFDSCSGLTEITVLATDPLHAGYDMFYDCNELTVIYVPDESVDEYKAYDNWSDYAYLIKPLSEKPAG